MFTNKSKTQHSFAVVPTVSKPRSVFNRSHNYKTAFDSDYLIPFYWANVSPGDSVKLRHSVLLRLLSPLVKPIMDNIHFDWFYFFVPYRLLWANFKKFMGEQANPADSISYNVPQCTAATSGLTLGSLHDYFGLPIGSLGGGATGLTFNNLYPRAYNAIWNAHFRDENLQNSVTIDTGDGPDTIGNYVLLKRGKRHDYFTAALPWLQKAATGVSIPLGTTAPVVSSGGVISLKGGTPLVDQYMYSKTSTPDIMAQNNWVGTNSQLQWGANTGLLADLSTATAATVNTLRQSIALQQFLENDARGGTRYVEIVKQRWGVTSPDARQQRSEILSLGTSDVRVTTVARTTNNTDNDNQAYGKYLGDLGGFATGANVGNGFTKSFTEHGCIIGLACVRSDLSYQYGIDREWSYRTRYDFYNPEFATLGEQSILNKEIYANLADGTASNQKDGVFGYQERYAEYRYAPRNTITGILRSNAASTLDVWHLAQKWTSQPTLGDTFIQQDTPLDRAIYVPSQPHWLMDVAFDEKWARVMPLFGVPGLTRL